MSTVDTAAPLTGEQYDLLHHIAGREVTGTIDGRWIINVSDLGNKLCQAGLAEAIYINREQSFLRIKPAGERAIEGFGATDDDRQANPHPFDEADIAVATKTLRRWYGAGSQDINHAAIAVSVLSAVMVARHKRDAARYEALPFWKRLILALAR